MSLWKTNLLLSWQMPEYIWQGYCSFFKRWIANSIRLMNIPELLICWFLILDSWSSILILAFRNLNVVTFATWELSFEDQVETVNLHLSCTVAEEFTFNGFQMIVTKSMPKEYVIPTIHNGSKQCDEPIRIPLNYQ